LSFPLDLSAAGMSCSGNLELKYFFYSSLTLCKKKLECANIISRV
jgi:hypothetical protein